MHPLLADRRRFQLHLLAWGLVGLMLGLLARTLLGVRWIDGLVFGVPLGLIAAPISLSAWYVCRAMPLTRTSAARVAATALGASLVTAAIWAAIGRGWLSLLGRAGFGVTTAPVPAVMVLLVGLGALAYLLSLTVHYLFQAFAESADAARLALESQIAQRDAELRALRAQVDPHFLFNSLNSIAGLVGPAPDQARLMCQLLGDFLRDSLALGASPRISIGREVALAEQYLRVEQVRFGRRLDLRTSVSADAASLTVPPLLLQPLVENAVRHGIATCLEGGLIEVTAHRAGARAVIEVANPRDPDGGRRGTGFGLEIVRRRLAASFGDDAALAIDAAASRYRVIVTLPVDGVPA